MKKYSIFLMIFIFVSSIFINTAQAREHITALEESIVKFDVVVMATLPDVSDEAGVRRSGREEYSYNFTPIPQDLPVDPNDESIEKTTIHPYTPTRQPTVASPVAASSFEALKDNLTTIPPDTQGAVGPNHVMTTLNDRVRIQSKTGTVLSTVLLRDFWGSGSRPFDPKVTYDPFNNRWIFTVVSNSRSPSSALLIAVSQTDNPLGAWNRFTIKADGASLRWADFPSLGFNNKWIVVQANMFNVSDNAFHSSKVYVFNKALLYIGIVGVVKSFTLTNLGGTQAPAIMYDNVHPTLYLLQNWNGNSGGNGFLRLYTLNGLPGLEVLSIAGFVSINSTWDSAHPLINGGFAPQDDTARRIMNNDSRILSLIFRNNSMFAAQTVFLPTGGAPTHSAIQWWQISPARVVQQFGRVEDISANLNMGNFYAFPSIAANSNNDVLIGYSRFNPEIFASGAYSFRLGTDLVNTLRGSVFLKIGLAKYIKDFGAGRVRWGDYSSTVVDPNGSDMWTIQEFADTEQNGTSRWSTWWGKIIPPTV